jgi:poly(3-hydroxybutyrate) depolymerase
MDVIGLLTISTAINRNFWKPPSINNLKEVKRGKMKKLLSILGLLLICHSTQLFAGDWRINQSFGGQKYDIYVADTTPDKMINGKRALMISLHGCAMQGSNFREAGNWQPTADEYGMVVVTPSTNRFTDNQCWFYWFEKPRTRTSGDSGKLLALAEHIVNDSSLNIDPEQVYITGLSSGGGMAYVMGCLAPDMFAGVGINAGPSLDTSSNCAIHAFCPVSPSNLTNRCNTHADSFKTHLSTQITNVVWGKNDNLVDTRYSRQNAEGMKATYTDHGAAFSTEVTKVPIDNSDFRGNVLDGTLEIWSDQGGPRITLMELNGVGHAWPAGADDDSFQMFIEYDTVDYPNYITEFFFANNRRVSRNHPPVVTITDCRQSGPGISCEGKVIDEDPGDSISSLKIKFLDNCDEEIVLIAETDVTSLQDDGSFSHDTDWPKDHTFYAAVVAATDSKGASATFKGPSVKVGDPPSITANADVNEQCINVSGTAQQGSREVDIVQVKVDSGNFEDANGTSNWNFEKCGLTVGRHSVVAKVIDVEGSSDCKEIEVEISSTFVEETDTITNYAAKNRYALYPNANYPNAPSSGFGLCDRTFVELINDIGPLGTLTIHGTRDGKVWCADPANLANE